MPTIIMPKLKFTATRKEIPTYYTYFFFLIWEAAEARL